MNRTLYIFVTSDRPDPYVNVIVHGALYAKDDINSVVFINVKGLDQKASASTVSHNVRALLEGLAKGEYVYLSAGKLSGSVVDLATKYSQDQLANIKRMYQQCLDKLDDGLDEPFENIDREGLRDGLARLRKKSPVSIFDVTAVKKSVIGDVLAVGLIEGIPEIYTFDSRIVDFDNPWRMLIHELNPGTENSLYEYFNMAGTPLYRKYVKLLQDSTLPINPVPHSEVVDISKYDVAVQQAEKDYEELQNSFQQSREQANGWFRTSLIAAGIGLVLLGIGVIATILGQTTVGVLSALSSVIPSGIAALFFAQSKAANERVDSIRIKLTEAKDLQSVVGIVNAIDDPKSRDKLRADIVRKVLGLDKTASTKS